MAKRTKKVDDTVEEVSTVDLMLQMEADMKKAFKDDSARAFENYKQEKIAFWYPTGIATLDAALGGGLAAGRPSMIWGEPSGGKSTLSYSVLAAAQAALPDRIHILVDLETSVFDSKKHAASIGVDFTLAGRLFYIGKEEGKPLYAEDVFAKIEWIMRNPKYRDKIGLIIIDSIGALVSRAEGEKKDKWEGAARVGGMTHALSMFFRNTVDNGLLYESNGHMLLINQVRANIGGSPWQQTKYSGGFKLEHICAQIIEITKVQSKQDFGNPKFEDGNPLEPKFLGQRIKFKIEKNKVGGKQSATASIDYLYDSGLDYFTNTLNMAEYLGILVGTSWKTLVDPSTGEEIAKYQGAKQWKKALEEDERLWAILFNLVYATMQGEDFNLAEFGEPEEDVFPREMEVESDADTEELPQD